jgi:homospermidine synthase
MVWAIENPDRGICEADEMDFKRCLEVQSPYLGPVIGTYTDWNPLSNRGGFFPDDVDPLDPWQFRNILVHETTLSRTEMPQLEHAKRKTG